VAQQGETERGRLRVNAAVIAIQDVQTYTPSADLTEDVARLLDLPLDRSRATLGHRLSFLARNYLAAVALDQSHLSLAEARKALKRMATTLTGVLATLNTLHPMQALVLSEFIPPQSGNPDDKRSLIDIKAAIRDLGDAAEVAHLKFKPRRGPRENNPLKYTIGALMLLFEKMTGERATVSLNADGIWQPRLGSPQAQAVALVIRSAKPTMQDVTIVDVIHEINNEFRGKPLDMFEPLVWVSSPDLRITHF
jgi:hypothetical protein